MPKTVLPPPREKVTPEDRESWAKWLEGYGGDKFFDAFIRIAQDARGKCVNCHEPIYLDIVEGGGVPDWRTADGDYGCNDSPETDDEGCGGHEPHLLTGQDY